MKSKDTKLIRSALVVVRESEIIISRLEVSIILLSSRENLDGTKEFLGNFKKKLWLRLVISILGLSDTTLNVLKDLWSWIAKIVRLSSW